MSSSVYKGKKWLVKVIIFNPKLSNEILTCMPNGIFLHVLMLKDRQVKEKRGEVLDKRLGF